MILISSFTQVGVILSAILGTELYVSDGWVLVGIGVASLNILPLVMLPLLRNIKVKESFRQKAESSDGEEYLDPAVRSNGLGPQLISLWPRKITFYFPDVVLFLNNMVAELIGYVLPARILYSTTLSLTSAVPLLRIFGIVSFLSALSLSFIAGRIKSFNIFGTMAVGNLFYHGGAVIAFP